MAYRPHYRLLRGEYACYFPALLEVWQLAQKKEPVILAIDGRCGSGKTGLASLVRTLFPCSVFHLDNYYLPLDRRTRGWEQTPGGNIDFDRFLAEVLLPVQRGEAVCSSHYDCQRGAYLPPQKIPFHPLTIVEGSYSHHPRLAGCYHKKLFLTCGPEVQARRLQKREGDYFSVFESRWIPLEEGYFSSCHVMQRSDLILDTGCFF